MKYPFSPEVLDAMPEHLAELYRSLELFIINAIGEQIKKGDSLNESSLQKIRILKSHGIDIKDIEREIRKTAKISKAELDALIRDAIKRNEEYHRDTITKAQLIQPEVIVAQKDIDAIAKQTIEEFVNITQSMGFLTNVGGKRVALPPAKAYQWALDNASMQVQSGAISYNQAISNAIKQLADGGMGIVEYESGHVDKVDVAVRRAVMTGVSQLSDKYTVASAEYLGTPYFEVSAHAGARDKGIKWQNHKEWQGKVYSIKQGDKYPSIYSVCGLGEVDGLEGANCRHRRYPFVDGVSERTYTDEQLANIDKPNFKYQGKEYSTYEATQEQRRIERTIRKLKRQEQAFKSVGDTSNARSIAIRRQRLQRYYKDFSKAAQLPEQAERMKAYIPPKTVANGVNRGNIKGIDIDVDTFTPCLVETKTGNIVKTRYTKASIDDLVGLKRKGWKYNWKIQSEKSEIYKLLIDGSDDIQGLIAIEDRVKEKAYHVSLAESAPHNLGKDKIYQGVGGHLFAIACKKSLDNGYGGYIYFEAKNRTLLDYYREKFGAIWFGIRHEYAMVIDEDAALKLLNEYNFEGD